MPTVILKHSNEANKVPVSGDLVEGEVAINIADKKIYTKNDSGQIVKVADVEPAPRWFRIHLSSIDFSVGQVNTGNQLRVRITQTNTTIVPILIDARFAGRSSGGRRSIVEQKVMSEGQVQHISALSQNATGLGTDVFKIVNDANATTYDIIFEANQSNLIHWVLDFEVLTTNPNDVISITEIVNESQ